MKELVDIHSCEYTVNSFKAEWNNTFCPFPTSCCSAPNTDRRHRTVRHSASPDRHRSWLQWRRDLLQWWEAAWASSFRFERWWWPLTPDLWPGRWRCRPPCRQCPTGRLAADHAGGPCGRCSRTPVSERRGLEHLDENILNTTVSVKKNNNNKNNNNNNNPKTRNK